jgi:hypothetical protein
LIARSANGAIADNARDTSRSTSYCPSSPGPHCSLSISAF